MTEWVSAIDLMNDDEIVTLYGSTKVKSKTNSREENVYDIQVQNIHYFPLENGVITHNCTDLSVAGKQAGMIKGETRSGLVYEIIRIIKNMKDLDIQPTYLLMENVDALINKKNLPTYKYINEEFKQLGYSVKYDLINAKNTGIPQNRNRVFALYYKNCINMSDFNFPKPFDNGIRLVDILENDVDEKYYITNEKAYNLIKTLLLNGKISYDEEDYEYIEVDETVTKKRKNYG